MAIAIAHGARLSTPPAWDRPITFLSIIAQDIKAELASMGISPDHVFGPKRRRHHVRVIDHSHQNLTAPVETDTNDHASRPPVTAIATVDTPACICVLHAMEFMRLLRK